MRISFHRLASLGSAPQREAFHGIAALWTEAFGDPEAAVAKFFQAFPDCLSYVAEEDGQIVAMVHALPQVLSPDIPAAYVYAVATRRSHRRRGICKDLMAFAERDLQSRFRCTVLAPAELGLFDYYEQLGYRIAFTRKRTACSDGTPISPDEYLTLREQLLTEPHMVCDRNTLTYAADVYGLTFYKTETGIAAAAKCHTAERLPEDISGDRMAYAMLKWLSEPMELQTAYLGFALE